MMGLGTEVTGQGKKLGRRHFQLWVVLSRSSWPQSSRIQFELHPKSNLRGREGWGCGSGRKRTKGKIGFQVLPEPETGTYSQKSPAGLYSPVHSDGTPTPTTLCCQPCLIPATLQDTTDKISMTLLPGSTVSMRGEHSQPLWICISYIFPSILHIFSSSIFSIYVCKRALWGWFAMKRKFCIVKNVKSHTCMTTVMIFILISIHWTPFSRLNSK